MTKASRIFLAMLPVLVAVAPAEFAHAQMAPRSIAAAQLRNAYYAQDFSRVVEAGKPLLKQYPNDLELRAWYAVGEYRTYQTKDLPAIADAMKKTAPASPWTLLAGAVEGSDLGDVDTKLASCEKALAQAGTDEDVLVLATDIVSEAAYYQHAMKQTPTADTLKEFIAKHRKALERFPQGLAAEAEALDRIASLGKGAEPGSWSGSKPSTPALKVADRVLKSDPGNVAALLLKSQALVKGKQYQADYDLLKAGAHAAPDSCALHLAYWKAVLTLPNSNPQAQKQEILADAAQLFSAVRPSTDTAGEILSLANGAIVGLGDLLMKQYPNSSVEDAVIYRRATAVDAVTEQQRTTQIVALEAFIDRPAHHDSDLLSEANYTLVDDLTNINDPDLDRLYRAELATAGGPYGVPVSGVMTLADHKAHLPELEALAKKQLDALWASLGDTLKGSSDSSAKSEVQSFLQYNAGSWLGAVGWVELQEGKVDAAFPELEAASNLSPQDPEAAIHLGRAYEARNENARAEKLFRDSLSMSYWGDGDHPALAALRELYLHTHGSAAGLDAYMQPILASDAARRRKTVLATRLSPEKPIVPFELASLDGKMVGSEGLRGKYLILNFWATW